MRGQCAEAALGVAVDRHVVEAEFADRAPAQQTLPDRLLEAVAAVAPDGRETAARRARGGDRYPAEVELTRRVVVGQAAAGEAVEVKRPRLGRAVQADGAAASVCGAARHARIAGEITAADTDRRRRVEPVIETERHAAGGEATSRLARRKGAVAEHELARDEAAEPAVRQDQSRTAIGGGKLVRLRRFEQVAETARAETDASRCGGEPGRPAAQRAGAAGELVGQNIGEQPAEQGLAEDIL